MRCTWLLLMQHVSSPRGIIHCGSFQNFYNTSFLRVMNPRTIPHFQRISSLNIFSSHDMAYSTNWSYIKLFKFFFQCIFQNLISRKKNLMNTWVYRKNWESGYCVDKSNAKKLDPEGFFFFASVNMNKAERNCTTSRIAILKSVRKFKRTRSKKRINKFSLGCIFFG